MDVNKENKKFKDKKETSIMKKKVLAAILMGTMVFSMAACGGNDTKKEDSNKENYGTEEEANAGESLEGEISVISREEGSGTRGAFVELFGIQEEIDGEKVDMTTEDASVTNSTSVMMTNVAQDPLAIGYISLGSLDESVKALKVDGAEATTENVKNESYKVSRPFNIATKEGVSDVAQDFIDYIMSAEGQKIVEESGFIAIAENAEAYAGTKPSGKIVVGGSSSVTPVMEKLKEAYEKANGGKITVEVQQSDSTTGITSAAEGICDIGMASRELKDEETKENLTATEIARDGIAVVVNNDNDIDELTSDQVKAIFTGETTDWEDLAK